METRKKKKSDQKGKLYDKALKLAKDNSLEDLYLKTRLPISWLRKFRAGNIANPSVNRVEILLKSFGKI